MALDFSTLLEQYLGHRIRVRLNGYTTISGDLVRLNTECMVLMSTRFHGDEDGNEWYTRMAESDPDLLEAQSEGATIIKLSHISCVSCQMEEPIELEAKELAAAAGKSQWTNLPNTTDSWPEDDDDDGTIVAEDTEDEKRQEEAAKKPKVEELNYAPIDPIVVELGWHLLPLADPGRGGTWMSDVSEIRKCLYEKMGFPVPRVRLRDNLVLGVSEYRILIHGVPVGNFCLELDKSLVLFDPHDSRIAEADSGIVEPAFEKPCKWIRSEELDDWVTHQTVDCSTIWRTHLTEAARRHAHQLLSFETVQHLVDELKVHHPLTVSELFPHAVSLRTLFGILQRFLKENISIRNLHRILMATADASSFRQSIDDTYAAVRKECGSDICKDFLGAHNQISAVTLDPLAEESLYELVNDQEWNDQRRLLISEIQRECDGSASERRPLLVRNGSLRSSVWEYCNSGPKRVSVIAVQEVPRHAVVNPSSIVRLR